MSKNERDILFQHLANSELRDSNSSLNDLPSYVGDFKPKPKGWQEGYIFWRAQYMRRNHAFVELVPTIHKFQEQRREQKPYTRVFYKSDVLTKAVRRLTDNFYHDPFTAELNPMPVMDIIRIFESKEKVYPTQVGVTFEKSMPFRYGFFNSSEEPHTLKMDIDYTKDVNHIVRYVANHVLLAQGLIKETPLEQIYAEIPEKYKLGDQVLSALFTQDDKFPVSYNQSSDMGRAIGLWLWEFQQQHPEMPKTEIFATLAEQMPDKARDYKELSQYLKHTTACIEAMQVLKHSA